MHATTDCPITRHRPVLPDPLQLQLSQRQHHRPREPADRRRRIERVPYADQRRPRLLEPLQRDRSVGHAARKPVERVDRDPVRLAPLDTLQRRLETRPLIAAPRLIEILLPDDDRVALRSGELLHPLTLHRRADERVALTARNPAHTDIADQTHTVTIGTLG